MRRMFATIATGALALAALGAGPPPQADAPERHRVVLDELNDSGAFGTGMVTRQGDQVRVQLNVHGADGNVVGHAQHVHARMEDGAVLDSECPGMDAAGDDGVLTTVEGIPAYGLVRTSLTTTGDTSPDSATAGLLEGRFPAANDGGNYRYDRTLTVGEEITEAVADSLDQVHIVVHGLDVDGDGAYDLGEGTPPLLQGNEATLPIACGSVG